MRHVAPLILAAAALACSAGCGSAETKDDARPPAVAPPLDSPPPTAEAPDFGDPKPPVPARGAPKEVESTRDSLLHTDGH